MKYWALRTVTVPLLLQSCGQTQDTTPPEVSASTRWRRVPEWQFIKGEGRNDAVFDPHTSLYCSFDRKGDIQVPFCVVMAPDNVMSSAIAFDTAYIELARIRAQQIMDSIQKADKQTH